MRVSMDPQARTNRRRLLQAAAAAPLLPLPAAAQTLPRPLTRVRPRDPDWQSAATWTAFGASRGGALVKVQSPWAQCLAAPAGVACAQLFKSAKNPYFLGDDPALTQTLGWVDAWTSAPSVYAVAARNTADV